jgi:hypothetical protein
MVEGTCLSRAIFPGEVFLEKYLSASLVEALLWGFNPIDFD